MAAMNDSKFIIIYDTYCGWCYGAAPLFDALVASGAEVEVLHRNLFRDQLAYRMNEGKDELVMQADAKIAALTGQPFNQDYIDNVVLSDTEVLDSTYTAQAAALLHDQGAHKEFSLRARLETDRYIHGISAQDQEKIVDALIAEGISKDKVKLLGTPELMKKSEAISARATELMKRAGTHGVPSILKLSGASIEVIDHAAFYGNPDGIKELARDTVRQGQHQCRRLYGSHAG